MNTTFYYASLWDVEGPDDIRPSFSPDGGPNRPLNGSETGSFTLSAYRSVGIPGYLTRPDFNGSTYSGDSNLPGHLDFSFKIAFSTTPIDASVFAPSAVPEPGTWALALLGMAALAGHRHRVRS